MTDVLGKSTGGIAENRAIRTKRIHYVNRILILWFQPLYTFYEFFPIRANATCVVISFAFPRSFAVVVGWQAEECRARSVALASLSVGPRWYQVGCRFVLIIR